MTAQTFHPETATTTATATAATATATATATTTAKTTPPRTQATATAPLPPTPTLIGREAEARALTERLAAGRVVTATGPGGIGKSALVASLLPQLTDRFGKVTYADLSEAATPTEAAALVREAATAHGPGGLLLLDDCRATGPELARALTHTTHPTHPTHPAADPTPPAVLLTSRHPVRATAEQLFALAPLAVPPPFPEEALHPTELERFPSVSLLMARAAQARAGFALTEENAAAVAGLCILLEGLPLALVLAADRLRLFTPQVLLGRLAQGGAALTGLSGGPADAPDRHRSLAALAASQVADLAPEARRTLERLAVFAPGFGMPMADRALRAPRGTRSEEPPLDALLDTLLDAHLITAGAGSSAGAGSGADTPEPHLTVPEPVRSYLREQLARDGRLAEAQDRHADAYHQLVLSAEPRLAGPEEGRWLRILAAEHANTLTALDRLEARGDRDAAASMLLALRTPWLAHGHLAEGVRRCERLLAEQPGRPAPAEPVQARLIDLSASFTLALGDADLAVRRHRRALALCKRLGDRRQSALVTARLGTALLALPDAEAAEAALRPALAALESLGATAPAAEAATALARALRATGRTRKAAELREQALDTHRRIQATRGLAEALTETAEAAEAAEATGATEAAEAAGATNPAPNGGGAGEAPRQGATQGDLTALKALREALSLYAQLNERTRLPAVLEAYTLTLLRTAPGAQPLALRLLGAAEALRGRLGSAAEPAHRARVAEALTGLRTRMHPAAAAVAWAEGLRLEPAGAVDEALAQPLPTRAAATGPAVPVAQPLTGRQVQVAMLVAEGLTNRQIADRLKISEWTVVNHVRQIMRRLGCASRVQVAWAVGRWS
ncbi:LuxR C-terminal-related transcriptional regulator [Streptomyces sp. NPDC046876]|uniref:helix-turn-helix transcriptional regulator n=1 Tax=Streptomyces sp. NPDC046876 TaxID=3155616 RepID=UPI0033F61A9F